jgi:hypothetical protein
MGGVFVSGEFFDGKRSENHLFFMEQVVAHAKAEVIK